MSEYGTSHAVDYAVDSVANIFEPDVVLPSQFFDNGAGGLNGGERKLMAAILSDGIEAFLAQAARGTLDKSEAGDWVSTKDLTYVFSFDSVCQCLGIDPDYLRLGIERYVDSMATPSIVGERPKRIWKKIRRPRK